LGALPPNSPTPPVATGAGWEISVETSPRKRQRLSSNSCSVVRDRPLNLCRSFDFFFPAFVFTSQSVARRPHRYVWFAIFSFSHATAAQAPAGPGHWRQPSSRQKCSTGRGSTRSATHVRLRRWRQRPRLRLGRLAFRNRAWPFQFRVSRLTQTEGSWPRFVCLVLRPRLRDDLDPSGAVTFFYVKKGNLLKAVPRVRKALSTSSSEGGREGAVIMNFQQNLYPVSSEISDLLLIVSCFASQCKGIKFGDYFFDGCCVN